jgi:predicted RecA/RadA family phage recombinase
MKNFKKTGKTLTLTAPYQRNSGEAAKIGSIIAVATSTVASGADTEWMTEGVFDPLAKASGQAWTQGVKLYWDDTAKNFTTTSTSNTPAGVAAKAAQSADTTGQVKLGWVP